ncbi:hypothetical protein KIN20_003456 [Parelaphostrongylus tenuis]|uniref:Uncharacterized protein n=1 Tax=Parelaphostrongylus tenuis TaxID=148309 RepID=A0AAD5QIM1_PARTN|nr:hypothetical protein KIN20_003456 [Parelaphostrongylus tenuis]
MRKPNIDIYQYVCEKMKVTPMECVFLDDLEPNVVAARKLGFITIKVISTSQAVADLKLAVKELLDIPAETRE